MCVLCRFHLLFAINNAANKPAELTTKIGACTIHNCSYWQKMGTLQYKLSQRIQIITIVNKKSSCTMSKMNWNDVFSFSVIRLHRLGQERSHILSPMRWMRFSKNITIAAVSRKWNIKLFSRTEASGWPNELTQRCNVPINTLHEGDKADCKRFKKHEKHSPTTD